MNTVAFLTYNTVGRGVADGWHEANGRRALVLQNTKGRAWLADQTAQRGSNAFAAGTNLVQNEIGDLWERLVKALPEIDHVVVYVGSDGSENAIRLASALPAGKVTFVRCSCGLSSKDGLIASYGLAAARKVGCECGGHATMGSLFREFMQSGSF